MSVSYGFQLICKHRVICLHWQIKKRQFLYILLELNLLTCRRNIVYHQTDENMILNLEHVKLLKSKNNKNRVSFLILSKYITVMHHAFVCRNVLQIRRQTLSFNTSHYIIYPLKTCKWEVCLAVSKYFNNWH